MAFNWVLFISFGGSGENKDFFDFGSQPPNNNNNQRPNPFANDSDMIQPRNQRNGASGLSNNNVDNLFSNN